LQEIGLQLIGLQLPQWRRPLMRNEKGHWCTRVEHLSVNISRQTVRQ